MNFDDTTSSGMWWATNVAIKDACNELKEDTKCSDNEISKLLRSIADHIDKNGL